MSDTKIAWTNATWNPVTGCSKVSPGCANCYAEKLSARFGWTKKPWTPENAAENVVLHPERLDAPLRWKKPRMVFVNSMSDLFHEQVPDEFIWEVFAVMRRAQRHTFQVLTKRPERMIEVVTAITRASQCNPARHQLGGEHPSPNVWLGVSVENQRMADERIPLLLQTPATVRFVSCEPLLGPVDLTSIPICTMAYPWSMQKLTWRTNVLTGESAETLGPRFEPRISWVIVGGESGPKRRPFDLAWARSLRDQCKAAGKPMFFKQTGGPRPGMPSGDPELDALKEFP